MNRRELFKFFGRGAAALCVWAASEEPLFGQDNNQPIHFWAAVNLLWKNIDYGFFARPGLLDNVRQRFHIKYNDFEIKTAAYIQIWGTAKEFKQNNPWDTDQTRYEAITPQRLKARYIGRLSRLFHKEVAPDYAKILGLPAAEYKWAFDKQFGEMNKLFPDGLICQLGCATTVNEKGQVVAVDPDWNDQNKHPHWTRRLLDLDYICAQLPIPQLLNFTEPELKAAGEHIDDHPIRTTDSAGAPVTTLLAPPRP
jgi:hypothetical protein